MRKLTYLHRLALTVLGLFVLPLLPSRLPAQPAGNPAPSLAPADSRWQDLAVARKPSPHPERYAGKSAEERAAVRTAEIATYVAMADQLRAFCTDFPQATQVPEAKLHEALNLLLAAQTGDTAHAERRQALVNEVRHEQGLSAADRFAVAAQADYLAVARNRALSFAERLDGFVKVARGHAVEFPTEPGGFTALLALAKDQPATKGQALAVELAAMPAPESVKQQAAHLVQRFGLVGRKLDQILGEAKLPGTHQAGAPLVIYAWASWSEASQRLADKLKASAGDVTLIGLCLDTDLAAAKTAAEKRPPPGQQVYDSQGAGGALAQALKLDDAGWLYLIDRSGTVLTVRGQDDLSMIKKL